MKAVLRTVFASLLFLLPLFAATSQARTIVPEHEVLKTRNGIPVYFFPSPNLPIFQVDLVFSGGSEWDPELKSGIGAFSTAMLRRGIPGMDEDAIFRKTDDLAAGIDFSVSDDRTFVTAYGLNEHVDEIVDLMFNQITTPTFPEKPFLRLKANHVDSIEQLPDSPGAIASHVLDLLIFNGTSRARPSSGFKNDVKKLTLAEVRAYYSHLLRTDRLKVLVVGGKRASEIAAKVMRNLELLPCEKCGTAPRKGRKWVFPSWKLARNEVLLLERPGISEAHIRMGFLGPKRLIPEFFELRVAETILSGYYLSRMNQVIREKLNLTYGISAGFDFGAETGIFTISTSTRNEKVSELLLEVNKLMKDFAGGNISQEELQFAKDFINGSFPLALQNRYVIASTFFSGLLNGLPIDFLDTYQSSINKVTLEGLRAAVKKYVRLDQMTTVIAGDPKAISAELRKAKMKYRQEAPRKYL
ncbi:MAG: pitrilysin family protein [Bdellovibrionota bacterium]